MPDSGKMIHLRTPAISESVRIDAGFIEGDTVSSAYDGMIAKLIVGGETRELAIRKLHAALQEYEVVGLSTNIEFLKKICESPAFIRGNVETGYIQKYNDELFAEEVVEPEVYAQAALGLLAKELAGSGAVIGNGPHGDVIGFGASTRRQFTFVIQSEEDVKLVTVSLEQRGQNLFDVEVKQGEVTQTYDSVVCKANSPSISTFFSHTRIESTIIANGDKVSLFQHGKKTQLTIATPNWFEKALGLKVTANSVLAPMPCKVLRNEVKEGDEVQKGQALVV